MIMIKHNEMNKYITQRQFYIKTRQRASVELRKHESIKDTQRRITMTVLDPRKIKSRLSELFKQQTNLKRAESSITDGLKTKRNSYKQYFNKSFLKRKQKGDSYHHLVKQKMQIINDESNKQIEPLFDIKEIKIKRKGSPYNINEQKISCQQIYKDRYSRVLTFAKTKFRQKLIIKKPYIPDAVRLPQNNRVTNNFVKTRNKFRSSLEQKNQFYPMEPLEPWTKLEEIQNNQIQI